MKKLKKLIKNLDSSKAIQLNDIPINIIKQNSDIFAEFICDGYNKALENSNFPDILKLASVTPSYKIGLKTLKGNYRPISILPVFSKIFERIMHKQMLEYFEDLLSDFQCGFSRGYSIQHCLIVMIEIWKQVLDYGEMFKARLTGLSKVFDCISHELLIAKLKACKFDFKIHSIY